MPLGGAAILHSCGIPVGRNLTRTEHRTPAVFRNLVTRVQGAYTEKLRNAIDS